MLYLELPTKDYYNQQKTINLVLDQHQRMKDLFFNIRVFSSCQFFTQRASFSNLKHVQKIQFPNLPGGGVPTNPLFYQSPQVYFYFDRSKVINPGNVTQIETIVTFQSSANSDVKLYLINADTKERVPTIQEKNLVDVNQKTVS